MQTILKNSKPDISCIYVNYNSARFLELSLKTLFQWEADTAYEVIIVNSDASEEKEVQFLSKKYHTKLITAFDNPGFGAAVNRGALQAEGKLLFFVNPDTEWKESFFRETLAKVKKEKGIGVLGIALVSSDGRKETHNSGKFLLFKALFSGKQRVQKEVDWVSGGSLFISQEIFKRVGGFDERFFMYFEDMDLCLRVKKQNLNILQDSSHSLVHFGGKSHTSKASQKKHYDISLYRYTKKHWPFWQYLIFRFLHPAYRFLFPYGRK